MILSWGIPKDKSVLPPSVKSRDVTLLRKVNKKKFFFSFDFLVIDQRWSFDLRIFFDQNGSKINWIGRHPCCLECFINEMNDLWSLIQTFPLTFIFDKVILLPLWTFLSEMCRPLLDTLLDRYQKNVIYFFIAYTQLLNIA